MTKLKAVPSTSTEGKYVVANHIDCLVGVCVVDKNVINVGLPLSPV